MCYSRLPNKSTGALIWQISPIWQIWHWQIWDWPIWQNLPNKGTGTYISQARVWTCIVKFNNMHVTFGGLILEVNAGGKFLAALALTP